MISRLLSSLRWRLSLAMSGVVLLCAAVCVAGAVLFLRQALTDRATTDLRQSLNGVSGYLDNQRSDLLGLARLVAADPVVDRAVRSDDRQALIVHLTPFYADLNADVMDVIDARGRVVVRMEDTLAAGDLVSGRPSVRKALAGGEVVVPESDLPHREAAGGYALRATVPIRSGDRVIGAVVVGRQLDSIFAARIGHALDANVNLIAGNQRTGTTLTDSHGLPATGLPEPPSVLARITTGETSIATVQENGGSALSGLVPLAGADGRWIGAVEVVYPLEPLYDVIKGLSLLLLVLGAVVVAVGTLLALDISRRLTSRLRTLQGAASRVATLAGTDVPLGELYIAGAVQGNDEVASLARSFSAMMIALDERMAANADLYAAAQARVRELSGLAEIARLLTAAPSVHETMETLGEHVCRLVGCSAVAIWLPGEGSLPALHGGHGLPEEYEALNDDLLQMQAIDNFETTAQIALRSGHVAHLRLIDEPPEALPPAHGALRAALRGMGWSSATSVPLRIQDRIVGALTCYTVSASPLPESELSLLTTIADQVAVAMENARLYERAQEVAALEERQRLARELHDSVSQALFGIALGARTARTLLDRDPARVAEPLEYVLAQAEAGLTEMRALIFELRPEALEAEGLVAALEKQAQSLRARHGIAVEAALGTEPDAPPRVKEAVYRIAQEALHNTVKHARAQRVDLRLAWSDKGITLEVRDDGRGFDPQGQFPGHLGLRTMRERAIRLGGTLAVESAPGQGTRIRAEVPSAVATVRASM